MDSVTHLVFGGCLAAVLAPPKHRRAALLIGAALGTVPDLDVIPLMFADPVTAFTAHRGATHSLFVLPLIAVACWLLMRWRFAPAREQPLRWLGVCLAVLIAHPLLDAFTVYGTHLFWPLPVPPVMISSIFIIDPLFTLPLVVGSVAAWRWRELPRASAWLVMALALSASYLGWTLVAKYSLERDIRAQYAAKGAARIELLTVPTPFNSLAWRILVMGSDGYAEGFHSFLAPAERMELKVHPSSRAAPAELQGSATLQQLTDFTRGFYAVEDRAGRVVFTDLRMGIEPDYVFRFELAERKEGTLHVLDPPEQLPWPRYSRAQRERLRQIIRGSER